MSPSSVTALAPRRRIVSSASRSGPSSPVRRPTWLSAITARIAAKDSRVPSATLPAGPELKWMLDGRNPLRRREAGGRPAPLAAPALQDPARPPRADRRELDLHRGLHARHLVLLRDAAPAPRAGTPDRRAVLRFRAD